MLTKLDKSKILKLRSDGFSYQAIHEKLGFSKDTIMKVCKEEEARKIKGVEESPGESKKAEDSQIHELEVDFDNPIDKIRGIRSSIDDIINNGKLKAGEKRIWEERGIQLQEMLRLEVDERIPAEITKAINARDEQWDETIQSKYVQKDLAKLLKDIIDGKDTQISELHGENMILWDILKQHQSELYFLKNVNTRLINDNERLNYDLQNCYETMELQRDILNQKRKIFEMYTTNQNNDLETKQLKLIDWFNENHKKELDLEKQKKKVSEWDDALDIKSKKIDEKLVKLDKTQREIELEKENIIKEWTSIEKTKEQQKNITNKFTVLNPVSFNGPPVIQPEITQTEQSVTEPIVVECSGEPIIIRSGLSSINHSGLKVNTSGLSSNSFFQSGVST